MYLCQLAIPSPGVSATNNGQPQWHFHSRGRSYIVWALKGLVRARWDVLLRGGLHARATAHQLANDSRHAVRAWFAARQPARLLLVRLQQWTPSYTFLYPGRPNPSDDTTFQFFKFQHLCTLRVPITYLPFLHYECRFLCILIHRYFKEERFITMLRPRFQVPISLRGRANAKPDSLSSNIFWSTPACVEKSCRQSGSDAMGKCCAMHKHPLGRYLSKQLNQWASATLLELFIYGKRL